MSMLRPQGVEALVNGPADVLFATLHDLIDVEGQLGKVMNLSDAIARAREVAQVDKAFDSALVLQNLQKHRDAIRRTLPRVRLVK